MQRQCAWCLRLIDDFGVRISVMPVAKTYEASHGMCTVCAGIWLEEVLQDTEKQRVALSHPPQAETISFSTFFARGT